MRWSGLIFGLPLFCCVAVAARTIAPPRVEWEKAYGGDSADRHSRLVRTSDGGFILGGHSWSGVSGNKNTPNYGEEDFWVLRLDRQGNKLWEGNFGGDGWDFLWDLKTTSDGGCILVGESRSTTSGNKTAPRIGTAYNFWVVRLDANGNKVWDKTFNTNQYTQARSVVQTGDGGFLVGGTTDRKDYWIVRLNADGDKLWDRIYGGSGEDQLTDLHGTADGGFILAGYSNSPQGVNKSGPPYGAFDVWLVRIDSAGNKLWDRSYGGDADDQGRRVIQTDDGGFVVAASTMSGVSGSKTSSFYGGLVEWGDYWVLRLDAQGNQIWDVDFGGAGTDACTDVLQTLDGGFIVAGSTGGTNHHIWIVRLDGNGNEIWNRHHGESGFSGWPSVQATADGGILVAAETWADPGAPRSADLRLFKLSPDALTAPQLVFRSPVSVDTGFRFDLFGISNRTYVTEWSSDLQTWSALGTNRLMSGAAEIVDAAGEGKRFYRARMLE
jgi:hypothetical protein